MSLDGTDVLLIGRHSAGHKVPPHLVNYEAMAIGLKNLGIKHCLSTAAVGGLNPNWRPGDIVVCSDFLDMSARNQTMFSRQVVHTDFTYPFSPSGRHALLTASEQLNEHVEPKGIYLCGNGPRYETPSEIEMYRRLGAEMVGMTAATEAILMHEAGVEYACLAIVTNLAAGMSQQILSHEEVVQMMQARGDVVVKILARAAALLAA